MLTLVGGPPSNGGAHSHSRPRSHSGPNTTHVKFKYPTLPSPLCIESLPSTPVNRAISSCFLTVILHVVAVLRPRQVGRVADSIRDCIPVLEEALLRAHVEGPEPAPGGVLADPHALPRVGHVRRLGLDVLAVVVDCDLHAGFKKMHDKMRTIQTGNIKLLTEAGLGLVTVFETAGVAR